MTQTATTQAVMTVVLRSQGCDLEEIVHDCPGLTWNQVFLEVDRLSREGDVVLNLQQPGRNSVKPCIRHS
ncbi:MAG: hypothetical protein ACT4PN_12595 [Nitrospiraceae bacterium]